MVTFFRARMLLEFSGCISPPGSNSISSHTDQSTRWRYASSSFPSAINNEWNSLPSKIVSNKIFSTIIFGTFKRLVGRPPQKLRFVILSFLEMRANITYILYDKKCSFCRAFYSVYLIYLLTCDMLSVIQVKNCVR